MKNLLQEHHRVIIPGLGALLKKDKSATAWEDSLTFSPFLRFNDGLLEGYIIEKERIGKAEAELQMHQLVKEIQQTIAQHYLFYIDGLGAFYEDGRGAVQFLCAKSKKEALHKLEALREESSRSSDFSVAIDVEEELIEKKVQPANAEQAPGRSVGGATPIPPSTDRQGVAATKARQLEDVNASLMQWMAEVEERRLRQPHKAQEEPELSARVEQPISSTPEAPKLPEAQDEGSGKNAWPGVEESKSSDAPLAQPAPALPFQSESDEWKKVVVARKERRPMLAVGIAAVVVLALAVAAVGWFWDPISEHMGWQEQPVVDGNYVVEHRQPEDAVAVDEYEYVPQITERQQGFIYIVVLSLNLQKNAMAFCQSLYERGIRAEIVITNEGTYWVCVGKYSSMAEAEAALDAYTKKYGEAEMKI